MITAAKANKKTLKNNRKNSDITDKEVNLMLKYTEQKIKQAIELGTYKVFIDFSNLLANKPTRTAIVRLSNILIENGYEVIYDMSSYVDNCTIYISWFCDKHAILKDSYEDKVLLGQNVEKPWRMKVTEELEDLARQYKPEIEKMLNE